MTDFELGDVGVQVDGPSLVKPPVPLLAITFCAALASVACLLFSSGIGYLVAVGASILGGISSLQDQKRQGHPSYVTLSWFRPTLRTVRYLILAFTLMHVLRLAIDATKGSGILF